MPPNPQSLLDALPEPSLVVRAHGEIVFGNNAARSLLGKVDGLNLFALGGDDGSELRTFLRRCLRSSQPLIGKLEITDPAGQRVHLRCYGNRVKSPPDDKEALVLLRFHAAADDRFAGLKRQLDSLHVEIRHRRRIQALLEESVRERDLLLREIRHRIGNNFQMLLGMLSSARAKSKHPEAISIVERACRRIIAINAAQGLLYGKGFETVCTTDFVEEVSRATLEAAESKHELDLDVDRARLSNDLVTPVALVIGELITNALKHAFPDQARGRIGVKFRLIEDEFELTVSDNGIGFDGSEIENGGSGFDIVRGLVRQLGGRLEVHSEGGTRCVVRFQDRNSAPRPAGPSAGAPAR